ncbi:MAG: uracil-DNA glycosylase [Spirochaetia bacterium]|nr:uracil-DNA glycosylase [Spirochaetia bacterium]
MKKIIADLWNTLSDFEDLYKYGFRRSGRKEYVPFVPAAGSGAEKGFDRDRGDDTLEKIASEAAACRNCDLCLKRKKTVPGAGSYNPDVMIIGEGPGAEEDESGIPFVGAAGKYLDKWLEAIALDRKTNCFIGNVVKCRPPGNRDPLPDEINACRGYLERQIKILRPRAILTLGRIAGSSITGENEGIGRLRGKVYSFKGIPVIVTYHPSAVLRDKGKYRKPVWDDLRLLRGILDRNPDSSSG